MKNNKLKKIVSGAIILGVSSIPTTLTAANEVTSTTRESRTSEEILTMQSSEIFTESTNSIDSQMSETSSEKEQEVFEGKTMESIEDEIEVTFFDELHMYPSNRSDIETNNIESRSFSAPKATTPNVSVTDKNTPEKGFIDISSHNGSISVSDFKKMKTYGVTGVVVKLTESTTYTNPFAAEQVKNAQQAGLKVSAYHYSWFTDDEGARREAEHFVNVAKKVGLPTSSVMVNDIEEPKIVGKADHTTTSLAFKNRVNELGYKNVTHYMGAHWLNSGLIDPSILGYKNIWVAAYPYTLSTNQQYSEYGAWQWSSKLSFPDINGTFDISSDYSDNYTTKAPIEVPGYSQGLAEPRGGLWYRSHVSDYGWLGYMGTEEASGTTGQNRRLEAVDVMWNKQKNSIVSSYQDINGRWVESGYGITGTVGQALALQKVCFASGSDIIKSGRRLQYRVHSQDVGWSSWKEEGQPAGTNGKKIEAIEMRMIKNGVVEKG